MEFLDEDARPRILFQSRTQQQQQQPPSSSQDQHKSQFVLLTITISALLLLFSLFHLQTDPLKSLLLWLSLSLLLGPFAPSHLTAGHIRVGHGPTLQPIDPQPQPLPERKSHHKRSKPIRSEETLTSPPLPASVIDTTKEIDLPAVEEEEEEEEEGEWSEGDLALLKKHLAKNPAGKLGRWEIIAEAFKGRHNVESVIKTAKELGLRKMDGGDDYATFLKKRKLPPSAPQNDDQETKTVGHGDGWSSAEDIALLNALKAFPKDVAMRWDKIAAAVPGKSKADCVKRVSQLKNDFRSSKARSAR
ncbi:Myb_DNA-binding domain-containing protein [Cephalotus follicularis]|uniref:Myb_DNA-binding domain-containing protein n=1 Tax=Cephalotus follicularis TaxID=3775 RepID=A0A1Q3DC65_CEPFO|nr:Myb_DNA-binding domain-containing protein [Cephalotus follicularis]